MPPVSSSHCGIDRSDGAGVISPDRPASVRSEILDKVRRILQEEHGQTLVEYALIIAMVTLALVAALTGVSDALTRAFGAIASALGGIAS